MRCQIRFEKNLSIAENSAKMSEIKREDEPPDEIPYGPSMPSWYMRILEQENSQDHIPKLEPLPKSVHDVHQIL